VALLLSAELDAQSPTWRGRTFDAWAAMSPHGAAARDDQASGLAALASAEQRARAVPVVVASLDAHGSVAAAAALARLGPTGVDALMLRIREPSRCREAARRALTRAGQRGVDALIEALVEEAGDAEP